MKGGLSSLLKQAQDMQANLQKAQEELERLEIQGEAGGGMVKVHMNGRYDTRRVDIDPTLLGSDGDREMLEDLVVAAINDAVRKVEKISKEKMTNMVGSLGGMPEGFKLPF